MKAAVYARVSTANNGQDPRVQTRDLGEFCERRGWSLVEYVDIGISGTKDGRLHLESSSHSGWPYVYLAT